MSPAKNASWKFACEWYSESEIEHFLSRQRHRLLSDNDTPVPEDIHSPEFAKWLTNQFRLAMFKGIQVGRKWDAVMKTCIDYKKTHPHD